MIPIFSHFVFHPVGQGCFYSGEIHSDTSVFNFVYDCGSETHGPYLSNSIDSYKENTESIDLLILSHLHEDHVNGVSQLLSSMNCKNVVLPYLQPIERLYLAMYHIRKDDPNPEYIDFLYNPVSFLNQLDVENIYFIDRKKGKGEDPKAKSYNTQNSQEDREGGEIIFDSSSNTELKNQILKDDYIISDEQNQVKYLSYSTQIRISFFWEFCLYNRKVDSKLLAAFSDVIKEYFVNKFSIEGEKEFTEAISKVIKDKTMLKELAEIYKRYFVDLNMTSLCVYHGPMKSQIIDNFTISSCYSNGRSIINFSSAGTLLCGDYDLSTVRRQTELRNYLSDKWSDISVFQMPHHGSKYNWKVGTRRPCEFLDFNPYVFCFGLGNQYKHPHEEVVISLTNKNRCICLNNQISKFQYNIIIHKN